MRGMFRTILMTVGAAALLGLATACGNGEAASTPTKGTPAEKPPAAGAPVSGPAAPAVSAPEVGGVSGGSMASAPAGVAPVAGARAGAPVASALGGVASYAGAGYSAQTGIWVTGRATTAAEPDLAIINIGVETTAKTVAEARRQAADAMDAIVNALKARGIQDRDIQTTSFNIWPQYDYVETVVEGGRRIPKQVLSGYRVSNTATVKVRDMDNVGQIIDEVAEAGGDATRINGVSFTVEDPKPITDSLREAAVQDALAKAQQFAQLTGVNLGPLVYITELGGAAPLPVPAPAFAEAAVQKAATTPISGGELKFELSVQAVFAIQ